jgi:hypothetical protein
MHTIKKKAWLTEIQFIASIQSCINIEKREDTLFWHFKKFLVLTLPTLMRLSFSEFPFCDCVPLSFADFLSELFLPFILCWWLLVMTHNLFQLTSIFCLQRMENTIKNSYVVLLSLLEILLKEKHLGNNLRYTYYFKEWDLDLLERSQVFYLGHNTCYIYFIYLSA